MVDSALLSFLSVNNTHLVLTFSHLALGGVYLPQSNHTHIVAVITMGGGGDGGLVIGGEGGGGDVEVVLDGDLEGPLQVSTPLHHTFLFLAVLFLTLGYCVQ